MLKISGASKHTIGRRAAPQQRILSPPKSVSRDWRNYRVKRKTGNETNQKEDAAGTREMAQGSRTLVL